MPRLLVSSHLTGYTLMNSGRADGSRSDLSWEYTGRSCPRKLADGRSKVVGSWETVLNTGRAMSPQVRTNVFVNPSTPELKRKSLRGQGFRLYARQGTCSLCLYIWFPLRIKVCRNQSKSSRDRIVLGAAEVVSGHWNPPDLSLFQVTRQNGRVPSRSWYPRQLPDPSL